jgi:hypothetical protein
MATSIEYRSTLQDVDNTIAVAEREIGRRRTEQTELLHQARWNEALQVDREISSWQHWAESLRRYRLHRGDVQAAVAVDVRQWTVVQRVLDAEFDEARAEAVRVEQFERKRDPRPAFDAALRCWATLKGFYAAAFAATGDERFSPARLPGSPDEMPIFVTLVLDRRTLEVPAPKADETRWRHLIV